MNKPYVQWAQGRKITSIDQLPKNLQKDLYKFIAEYNPLKIYLVGSYANGEWIIEETPQFYKDEKKRIRYKNKISDLDIVVEPDPNINFYGSLHINPIKDSRVLLYDKTRDNV